RARGLEPPHLLRRRHPALGRYRRAAQAQRRSARRPAHVERLLHEPAACRLSVAPRRRPRAKKTRWSASSGETRGVSRKDRSELVVDPEQGLATVYRVLLGLRVHAVELAVGFVEQIVDLEDEVHALERAFLDLVAQLQVGDGFGANVDERLVGAEGLDLAEEIGAVRRRDTRRETHLLVVE